MIMMPEDIGKGWAVGGSTVDQGMPKGSEGAGLGRPKGAGAGVAAEVSVGLKHCLEIGKFISGLCCWHSGYGHFFV